MSFLREIFDKPFTQLRLEQQLLVGVIILGCAVAAGWSIVALLRHWSIQRRESKRIRNSQRIEISWEDAAGLKQHHQGRCRNISEGGLSIELPIPISVGTQIRFKVPNAKLRGMASVRHCSRNRSRYVIGLSFDVVSRHAESLPG
jgi:c-di-GMP-binding flagellar brake protein YcgR